MRAASRWRCCSAAVTTARQAAALHKTTTNTALGVSLVIRITPDSFQELSSTIVHLNQQKGHKPSSIMLTYTYLLAAGWQVSWQHTQWPSSQPDYATCGSSVGCRRR